MLRSGKEQGCLALRGAARAEANDKSGPIITVIDSRSDRDSSHSFPRIITRRGTLVESEDDKMVREELITSAVS